LWGIDINKEKELIDAISKNIPLKGEPIECYYSEELIQK